MRRADGSTIGLTVDGGSEVTATATIATAALIPWLGICNNAAVAVTRDLNLVRLRVTELGR